MNATTTEHRLIYSFGWCTFAWILCAPVSRQTVITYTLGRCKCSLRRSFFVCCLFTFLLQSSNTFRWHISVCACGKFCFVDLLANLYYDWSRWLNVPKNKSIKIKISNQSIIATNFCTDAHYEIAQLAFNRIIRWEHEFFIKKTIFFVHRVNKLLRLFWHVIIGIESVHLNCL